MLYKLFSYFEARTLLIEGLSDVRHLLVCLTGHIHVITCNYVVIKLLPVLMCHVSVSMLHSSYVYHFLLIAGA